MTVKVLDEYSGYEPVLNHVVYTRGTSIVPLVYTYPPPPSKKRSKIV